MRASNSASAREIFPGFPLGRAWRVFGFFFDLFVVVLSGPGFLRSGLGKSCVDFWFPASRSRWSRFIFIACSCFFVRSDTAWSAAVASSYSLSLATLLRNCVRRSRICFLWFARCRSASSVSKARSLLCVSVRMALHRFWRATLSLEKGRTGVSLR